MSLSQTISLDDPKVAGFYADVPAEQVAQLREFLVAYPYRQQRAGI